MTSNAFDCGLGSRLWVECDSTPLPFADKTQHSFGVFASIGLKALSFSHIRGQTFEERFSTRVVTLWPPLRP